MAASLINILENRSLQAFNTFGIDVKARYFATVHSEADLLAVISHPTFIGLPKLILGGGSNLLLTRDFPGVIIQIAMKGRKVIRTHGNMVFVEAAAGEIWHDFVGWTLSRGFIGLENLSLIPGSVGASPIQNIGAYGIEIKETFESLTAIDLATGQTHQFDHAACSFGYRDSVFKRELKDQFVITRVTFRLSLQGKLHLDYGDLRQELATMNVTSPTANDVSTAVCNIRQRKLPDPAKVGNAGSFFKNPLITKARFETLSRSFPMLPHYAAAEGQVKLPAGWLIEQAGWKGKTLGRAGVHPQHALVLINLGQADGIEILALAKAIQQSVNQMFNVHLEPEPVIL